MNLNLLAEGGRVELPSAFTLPVFETGGLANVPTLPYEMAVG